MSGREVQDIHAAMTVGSSVVASFRFDPLATDARRALVIYRLAYANFEVPDLRGDTNTVNTDNSFPRFSRRDGVANQFEIHVPILDASYLSAVGRFWNGSDPNPWSFQIGYSIDFSQGAGGLKKIFEGFRETIGVTGPAS